MEIGKDALVDAVEEDEGWGMESYEGSYDVISSVEAPEALLCKCTYLG